MTTAKNLDAKIDVKYDFEHHVHAAGLTLTPTAISTLQLNVTKLCNQVCVHCHVDASPKRREMMSDAVIDRCLSLLEKDPGIQSLDITGGAPELHPRFKDLVQKTRQFGKHVLVRHNLTVTLDPHPLTKESMEYLPDFFREQKVEVVSSLPYYESYFTDKQRGEGVFEKSIRSLKMLNERGFGLKDTGLQLNLVYNPAGAFLPAPQADLERDYKRELAAKWGVQFNGLFALTNLPVHRFKAQLVVNKTYEEYMEKLVGAFNPVAAEGVMCRSMISVSHDGKLYDCDFNQMLNMDIKGGPDRKGLTIFDFDRAQLMKRDIRFASHCFGCTAGAGSSCGGNTI